MPLVSIWLFLIGIFLLWKGANFLSTANWVPVTILAIGLAVAGQTSVAVGVTVGGVFWLMLTIAISLMCQKRAIVSEAKINLWWLLSVIGIWLLLGHDSVFTTTDSWALLVVGIVILVAGQPQQQFWQRRTFWGLGLLVTATVMLSYAVNYVGAWVGLSPELFGMLVLAPVLALNILIRVLRQEINPRVLWISTLQLSLVAGMVGLIAGTIYLSPNLRQLLLPGCLALAILTTLTGKIQNKTARVVSGNLAYLICVAIWAILLS